MNLRDNEADLRFILDAKNDEIARLREEIETLKGIKPELPNYLPYGHPLPRFGLRWNGPTEPLTVPLDDGYWTPWHYADSRIADLRSTLSRMADLRSTLEAIGRYSFTAWDKLERVRQACALAVTFGDGNVSAAKLLEALGEPSRGDA